MATYTVNKINWSNNEVATTQTGTLEYKLWSDPISSYTLVSASVSVNTNGTLVSPQAISGLTSGATYNIRFGNNCSSPVEYWTDTITAP